MYISVCVYMVPCNELASNPGVQDKLWIHTTLMIKRLQKMNEFIDSEKKNAQSIGLKSTLLLSGINVLRLGFSIFFLDKSSIYHFFSTAMFQSSIYLIESTCFSEHVVVHNNAVWPIIWKSAVAGFKMALLAFIPLVLMLEDRKVARIPEVFERVL